jgi:hypothetical protein
MAAIEYANIVEKKLAYLARFTPGERLSDIERSSLYTSLLLLQAKTCMNSKPS